MTPDQQLCRLRSLSSIAFHIAEHGDDREAERACKRLRGYREEAARVFGVHIAEPAQPRTRPLSEAVQ